MSRPRLVFMGTPQFAVPSLAACLEVADVVAVVTQPDKPQGRGQGVAAPPVKVFAQERGIPVLQPPKLRTPPFSEELRKFAPDVAVVTAYGKILPPDLLQTPRLGCLNVHASLLPRFRGAAPIQWAIAEGDPVTGVCLMQMDVGLDTGPVLACAELPIAPTDTSASLHEKLAALGGEVLKRELPRFFAGELQPVPQPAEGIVLARIIEKEDGALDFRMTAAALERRLRAFTPWPGAFTRLEGQLFKVQAMEVRQGKGAPGEVLAAGAEGIEVACGDGSVLLTKVQPEGKRVMAAREFLAGRKLTVGSHPFALPAAKEGAP